MSNLIQHTVELPSALFPFTLADIGSFDYGNYRLENVYQSISESQREACVKLWLKYQLLPNQAAAQARSQQVCYFITDITSRQLIGVNTLYTDLIPGSQQPVFMNRMFIDPEYRNSRLMITATAMMLVFAKTQLSNLAQTGVANINENVKLSRPGMNRIFSRLGYRRLGFVAGQEVLLFEFNRITIEEA